MNALTTGLFVVICLTSFTSHSAELNQRDHIAPAVQAKIGVLLAKSYTQGDNAPVNQNSQVISGGQSPSTQQIDIGGCHNDPNLREQNTVVNGSVTVICHHCR